jgi:DNA polymerase
VTSRDGEDAYDHWAGTYAPKYQWVKAYTDYRVINKFITTLETIRTRLYEDGCFPFDLLYFGAHTGRWAGAGGFNMQNMRKEPLYCDGDGWLVTDSARLKEIESTLAKTGALPNWVAFALDIRALFIARPGKHMIISDLSQIEPRVLAWLVKDRVMLDMMAKGQSPYEAHARATMNWTGGELKKADKELYALAKARVLGLGYGCGWKKFITVAYSMAGLDITKDDPDTVQATNEAGQPCFDADQKPIMIDGFGYHSKKIVAEYREQNPLICSNDEENPGIWAQLDRAFRDSVGGDFSLTLPSGRKLTYKDVRQERKAVVDPENPNKFIFKRCFTAAVFNPRMNGVVRENLYGGLLTENLVQATARDVFAEQLLSLDDHGIDPLWNVHDEAVTEADTSVSAQDVRALMSVAPEWMPGLPVDAEAQVVPHYRK